MTSKQNMIQEKGIVIEIREGRCLVRFSRKSACNKCGFCQLGEDAAFLWVPITIPVEKGQEVLVQTSAKEVVMGSIYLYLFPLVVFLLGFFLALKMQELFPVLESFKDFFPLAAGILFLLGAFFCLYRYDKKRRVPVTLLKVIE